MLAGNSAIFQPFDPLGRMMDSVTQGNVEAGDLSLIGNIAVGGSLELVFIMFDVIMQASNLLFEVAHFRGGLGLTLSDGEEEPIGDGSEDVRVEVRVGCQCYRYLCRLTVNSKRRAKSH